MYRFRTRSVLASPRLRRAKLLVLLLGVLLAAAAHATAADQVAPRQLWLYYPTNLMVDENVDKLEAIFRRAAAAGYSHVNITDSKFSTLDTMPPNYFHNVERVKHIAAELHLGTGAGAVSDGLVKRAAVITIRTWRRGCRSATVVCRRRGEGACGGRSAVGFTRRFLAISSDGVMHDGLVVADGRPRCGWRISIGLSAVSCRP